MFVITFEQKTDRVMLKEQHIKVKHTDGTVPRSICQALRLVREEFVRQGIEDHIFITKATWYEPDDERLRWVPELVSSKEAC